MLSRVLGCTHSYEVLEKIRVYFNLQTKSRARQLCISKKAVRLDSNSMEEFLLKINLRG